MWGIVVRDCVRGNIDDALCRTRFPEGIRIPWQKVSHVEKTSSAVLSGTGTLNKLFYVACDHGGRGAMGGLC